jgi:hypothetical protein
MSLTIPGNGASEAIYLQQNGGVIEYSVGATPGSYTTISSGQWPVTITNSNPGASSILRVIATTNLTFTSSYGDISGNFIAGSTYITFDGSGNTITLGGITTGITGYLGFIRNGTPSVNGQANVIVQNFITDASGSTLATSAGWLCQQYFGRGVSGNQITGCTNRGAIAGGGGSTGGISGSQLGRGGSVIVTNCTNSGTIGSGAGGISGAYCGNVSGSVTFTGCTNSGAVSGGGAGGITSNDAANNAGSVTFTNCANTGILSGSATSGICGGSAGSTNGSVTFTGCTNTSTIYTNFSGGICGNGAGYDRGVVIITNCWNSGDIIGNQIGGIIGPQAGLLSGLVTITKCFSTGNITGTEAGGIAGYLFATNTSANCRIQQCYSTGNIEGINAGGITGSNIGYSGSVTFTASVDIINCYSVGQIRTTTGGICGGFSGGNYTTTANIRITNSYSSGQLFGTGAGLVAVSLTSTSNITLTPSATYIAAGAWSDASANASLTGDPTNINTNNPGSTWTMITAGTPYVLSTYNDAVYSPSSTSSFTNYRSVPGLFQSGYTYKLLYTSQVSNVATARVFASKGTAPLYNFYNVNTFTLTNLNGGSGRQISATINATTGEIDFILPYPCFLEGTKILCFENNQEAYRPIENLRKGDLVKTIYNGYMPIHMIGTTSIYNPGNNYRITNRLYKCSREKYPTLFEDLYITGCHSILVPRMTNDQWENTKAVNGDVFVTDNHFRLLACADEKAEPYNKEGFMNIYHIALEHNDYYMNYGIYANGLLVESCSKRYLTELSTMRILGEEDCSVSEDVGGVSNNMKCQLIDIY